ncbi:MAG: DUF1080 domain-containing protein, partial [Planctomycetes bacterium]|nr:DUF1080 domain-containing protein [Planctomycetota bacterium]
MQTLARIAPLVLLAATALTQTGTPIDKQLPLPGEVFTIGTRTAFLIEPPPARRRAPMPWVFYAPTLPPYPSQAERWMFERFVAAGVAIAGIDVGESYGSPSGREDYERLYRELVRVRGMSPRPVLLARSRGGLMLYSWASAHARDVAAIAGIYPVCDLRSYPGLARACGAFGLDEAQLRAALPQHNPIERLGPLAAARVPIYHVHGDRDRLVPLAANSAELQRRYQALGGPMTLEVGEGHGHDMWSGFFENRALVEFVLSHAFPTDTRGLCPPEQQPPPGATRLLGPDGSRFVPEKADGEHLWRCADGVLTASPKWDSVQTPDSYRDFRMHLEFATNDSDEANPEGRGNSGVYIQRRYEVQILD